MIKFIRGGKVGVDPGFPIAGKYYNLFLGNL
jgi:hypothetical protein